MLKTLVNKLLQYFLPINKRMGSRFSKLDDELCTNNSVLQEDIISRLKGKKGTKILMGYASSVYQDFRDPNEASDWDKFNNPKEDTRGLWDDFDDHLNILKDSGAKVYRFSIEWSRIEPKMGEFNTVALNTYADWIRKCAEDAHACLRTCDGRS